MKNRKTIVAYCLLASLTFWGSGLFFDVPPVVASEKSVIKNVQYRPGELIVKFLNDDELYRITTAVDADLVQLAAQLSHTIDDVEYVEPNFIYRAVAFPNDPNLSLQWYLETVNAKNFWSRELLTREQEHITRKPVIAIVDTGVDLDHPDIKDKLWVNQKEIRNGIDDDSNGYVDDINGWDFFDNDSDSNPSLEGNYDPNAVKHGTLVASLAAAMNNNAQGIAGIGWYAQIMSLRVLGSDGVGDVLSVVNAIDYAVAQGADVINMSFVGTGFSPSLLSSIRRAYDKGVVVVAAAGNTDPAVNGTDFDVTKSYPVCYDAGLGEQLVIGVASVGRTLVKSPFSNYGSCIDIVAPGEEVFAAQVYEPSTRGFENYYDGYWSGTSLSAPLVSGTIATLKAIRPNFSVDQYADFIKQSAYEVDSLNPTFRGKLGAGLLDAGKAIELALGKIMPVQRGGAGNYIIAGLGFGSFPQLKILQTNSTIFKSFFAYSPLFSGAVNVATGNVIGDDDNEIVTSPGAGGGPHIRVFNTEGQVLAQFFAYDKNFRGGAWVALGDVTGDGVTDIITGSGKGMKPLVRIFNSKGALIKEFLAYAPGFTGGVRVAVGDVNRDGQRDIITAPGPGGGPHIRVFASDGSVLSQFFAFNQTYRGGVNIASADVHGDGQDEIIVAGESKSTPTVKVFGADGGLLSSFVAFDPSYLNGVSVAAGDVDGDGLTEIIAGHQTGSPLIRVFDLAGNLKYELYGHDKSFTGGVRTAVFSIK